jgi:hypothetical protein
MVAEKFQTYPGGELTKLTEAPGVVSGAHIRTPSVSFVSTQTGGVWDFSVAFRSQVRGRARALNPHGWFRPSPLLVLPALAAADKCSV